MDRDSKNNNSDDDLASPGKLEFLKKLMATGVSAAFLTEDMIRHFLGDVKLPRDVLNSLLQGAQKSKQELVDRVGEEIIKMVKKIDFVTEASRFVENHKFRISAEIEVVKKKSKDEDAADLSINLNTGKDPRIEVK